MVKFEAQELGCAGLWFPIAWCNVLSDAAACCRAKKSENPELRYRIVRVTREVVPMREWPKEKNR